MTDNNYPSRRSVLRLSGSALAATTLAGCTGGGGGDSGTTTTTTKTDDGGTSTTTSGGSNGDREEIRLGAKQSGWVGRKPQSIAGEKNPTLSLKAGQKYKLTWENLDGMEHELLIVDDSNGKLEESDKKLVKSDDAKKKGETVTVTFTASKQMAQYFCEYHAQTMKGRVKLEGG
ncbi:plastocyanin/azurin family copper-binding protein [Haladaptatus salinisoli]|uniref:plastocyanin/azurin family copper-binding protein n=1 Tax=Haladaptatus salinisoli TaxID=2884876 RepID=UPI001D09D065|nr:plastocyanin/azurin family copper-binding protein [Haladaptatus salinisoli]